MGIILLDLSRFGRFLCVYWSYGFEKKLINPNWVILALYNRFVFTLLASTSLHRVLLHFTGLNLVCLGLTGFLLGSSWLEWVLFDFTCFGRFLCDLWSSYGFEKI